MTFTLKAAYAILIFGSASVCATAVAQSPMGQSPPGPATPATTRSIEEYAAKAAQSDLLEVEAGKLAATQGQRDSVRQFGTMMVKDHTQSAKELSAALKSANVTVITPTSPDKEHQAKLDQLKPLQGHQFDQTYARQQVEAHQQALALHRSFAQQSGAALKSAAQKIGDMVEHHLSAAKALQASIDAESAEAPSKR